MNGAPARLLLLGGTSEASRLARLLAGRDDLVVITSLAGRTAAPAAQPGLMRVGGFGGTDGLAAYLRRERISLVVDATHPFAAVMRWHAFEACQSVGVPRMRVERPAWSAGPGDLWTDVTTVGEAAEVVASGSSRHVFLTIGRSDLGAFAIAVDRRRRWLIRSIDPPEALLLSPARVVLDRGPFSEDSEVELMAGSGVDLLVSKNSGGDATAAKLAAARRIGIGVVMVGRPPSPPGPVASKADEAACWVAQHLFRGSGGPPTGRPGQPCGAPGPSVPVGEG